MLGSIQSFRQFECDLIPMDDDVISMELDSAFRECFMVCWTTATHTEALKTQHLHKCYTDAHMAGTLHGASTALNQPLHWNTPAAYKDERTKTWCHSNTTIVIT